MEANEAQELQEHAEHGSHESAMRPVALTMTILAVFVAITTVLGHRTHTEAVLQQAKASDTWNEYQAKKNRAYDTALMTDLLSVVTIADEHAAQKIVKGYADHKDKWADDLKEEQAEALGLEAEVKLVACQMTMDLFEYRTEDMIDGVTVGGAATYMERALNSNVNLFI